MGLKQKYRRAVRHFLMTECKWSKDRAINYVNSNQEYIETLRANQFSTFRAASIINEKAEK